MSSPQTSRTYSCIQLTICMCAFFGVRDACIYKFSMLRRSETSPSSRCLQNFSWIWRLPRDDLVLWRYVVRSCWIYNIPRSGQSPPSFAKSLPVPYFSEHCVVNHFRWVLLRSRIDTNVQWQQSCETINVSVLLFVY